MLVTREQRLHSRGVQTGSAACSARSAPEGRYSPCSYAEAVAAPNAVVIGGGASGMLTALALSTTMPVQILEPLPGSERRWAYWSRDPLPVGHITSCAALELHLRREDGRQAALQRVIDPYRFRVFSAAALRSATEAAGVRWADVAVDRLELRGDEVVVHYGRGHTLAAWVFDSRPVEQEPATVRMSFSGVEIRTDDAVFTPGRATYMDFRARARDHVRFGYVLPSSSRTALVELVSFAPRGVPVAAREQGLRRYLSDVIGAGRYDVLRRESGDIPLAAVNATPDRGRVIRIGRSAGILKPSTGFGVTRMWRDARLLARAMALDGRPDQRLRSGPGYRYLDAVFLEVIRAQPEAIEPAMAALFGGNPPQRVLRFLDEEASLPEVAAIVASMPKQPFLAAAARLRQS